MSGRSSPSNDRNAPLPRPEAPRRFLQPAMVLAAASGAALAGLRRWAGIRRRPGTPDPRGFERRRGAERLEAERALLQGTLDAMSQQVAVLDGSGVIVAVNGRWRAFAERNGLQDPGHAVGQNYLRITEAADGCEGVARALRDVLEGRRSSYELEYPCHGPGRKRWFVMRARRFECLGLGWAAIVHEDVTELRQAIAVLRQSEAAARKLGLVARLTDSAVEILDREGRVEWVNGSLTRLTGYEAAEVAGRRLADVLEAEGVAGESVDAIRSHMAAGRGFCTELRRSRRSGQTYWVELEVRPVFDENGGLVSFVSIESDITARREADEAVRESERWYRTLAETLPQLVWTCRPDGACDFLGHRWREYTGAPEIEHLGWGWVDAVHADDRARTEEVWERATRTGTRYEVDCRIRGADGVYRWFRAIAVPIRDASGRIVRWLGSCTDVDDRIRAGEQIRRRAHQQEAVARLAHVAMVERDLRRLLRFAAEIAAATLEAPIGSVHELAPERDRFILRAAVGLGAADGEARTHAARGSEAGCALEADGPLIVDDLATERRFKPDTLLREHGAVSGVAVEIAGSEGRPFGVLAVHTTEPRSFTREDAAVLDAVANVLAAAVNRSKIECALRDSEAALALAQRCARAGVWEWEAATGRLRWSDEHFELYGVGRAPLTFERWLAMVHRDDREHVREAMQRAAADGRDVDVRFRIVHPEAGERWIASIGRASGDGDGRTVRVAGIAMDITDRVAAEAQRERQQEIEAELGSVRRAVTAMDQVLGVVGHELRTPLASLRLLSEFLLFDGQTDVAAWRSTVEQINGVSISMAEAVDGLLEAARIDSGRASWKWGPVDVGAICNQAMEVLRPLNRGKQVELRLVVQDDCREMLGDHGAVRRLLINLMTNACKHTREGTVELSVRGHAEGHRRWVLFELADTGCGMSREMLSRLGVPFALNSGSIGDRHASGSGLGVSICKTIAAAHGGTLRVSSTPGVGTRVRVRLRADLPAAAPTDDTTDVLIIEPAWPAGAAA